MIPDREEMPEAVERPTAPTAADREALRAAFEAYYTRPTRKGWTAWCSAAKACGWSSTIVDLCWSPLDCWTERYLAEAAP